MCSTWDAAWRTSPRWLTPPANEMPNIRPFYERMIARPAVARAMQKEGIKAFGTV